VSAPAEGFDVQHHRLSNPPGLSPVTKLSSLPGWVTTYLGYGLFKFGCVDVLVVFDGSYLVVDEFLEDLFGGSNIFTHGSHSHLIYDLLLLLSLWLRSMP